MGAGRSAFTLTKRTCSRSDCTKGDNVRDSNKKRAGIISNGSLDEFNCFQFGCGNKQKHFGVWSGVRLPLQAQRCLNSRRCFGSGTCSLCR